MEIDSAQKLKEHLNTFLVNCDGYLNSLVGGAHELLSDLREIRRAAHDLIERKNNAEQNSGDGDGEIGDDLRG